MTTSNEVIAALNQRRLLKAGREESSDRMPPGWQRWFDGMERVDAASMQARPTAWVDVFLQRPLRPVPRKSAAIGRVQAAISLLQQNWHADDREDRGLRIGAGALDLVMHLLLAALLLWLMYLGFVALQRAADEDEAVQVEFIGRGNVEEGGGALASEGAESAPAAAAPAREPSPSPAPSAASASQAAINRVEMPTPPPMAASTETPERVLEAAPLAQPELAQVLQVSEVPVAEPDSFQLPPPRERAVEMPEVQLREPQPVQQVERIATVRAQPVRTLQPQQREVELRMPEPREQVSAIQVFRPDPDALQRERANPEASRSQAQVQVPQLRGQVRDIPLRAGGAPTPAARPGSGSVASGQAANTGAGGERGTAAAAGQAQAGKGEGSRAAIDSGRGVASSDSGAGPVNRAAPGGWPGAAKSDDWGASDRNVAGTGNGNGRAGDGKGLFDDDGRARLPDEWTQQSGINVDRAGTWLKRPGLEYRGTRFDKYWIPQGTLLQEWVRRGIKKVSIPIPGTDTRLECVVSLLQLGGGCFPVNPDVNEQPATARPPPAVPFKPELQEDNGSLRPQDGGG